MNDLEMEIIETLVQPDENDNNNAIIELKPGTGGLEASLFTRDMMNMYKAYAENKGWNFSILEESLTDVGGIRFATCSIVGDKAYKYLKQEIGVHRVQRIPTTESGGRLHTSTMAVIVLPEYEDEKNDSDITKDIRIDVYKSSGAGGQHVNKTESAVRLTHIPTGIVVAIQNERSQHRNKATALKVLKSKIKDFEDQKNFEKKR